jgi:hypothetical protein
MLAAHVALVRAQALAWVFRDEDEVGHARSRRLANVLVVPRVAREVAVLRRERDHPGARRRSAALCGALQVDLRAGHAAWLRGREVHDALGVDVLVDVRRRGHGGRENGGREHVGEDPHLASTLPHRLGLSTYRPPSFFLARACKAVR